MKTTLASLGLVSLTLLGCGSGDPCDTGGGVAAERAAPIRVAPGLTANVGVASAGWIAVTFLKQFPGSCGAMPYSTTEVLWWDRDTHTLRTIAARSDVPFQRLDPSIVGGGTATYNEVVAGLTVRVSSMPPSVTVSFAINGVTERFVCSDAGGGSVTCDLAP